MDDENELATIVYKLTSLTFILKGCCAYYEGKKFDTVNLSEFLEILHETTLKLLNFL